MKAFCLKQAFDIELQERDIPKLESGQALIKVLAVSICGTDIHAYKGQQALFDYPRVIGHEICGVVEEIQAPDIDIKKGDKVVVIPYISCGKCIACRKGKTGCCENLIVTGVHRDGGMAEYMTIPADCLIKVPADTDPVRAAVIEPFAISTHAVHRADVKRGENVLVLGIGPIGLGVAEIAETYGANVIIADISEDRSRFVKEKYGYNYVLNPLDPDYREQLAKITNGDFPDTIIDTTGNGKSMESCFKYLSNGGKIVFVGIYNGDLQINDIEFHKRQTELYGSRAATKFDFEYVIKCMNEGKIDPLKFITHQIDFDDNVVSNFKMLMDEGLKVFKGVIKMSK